MRLASSSCGASMPTLLATLMHLAQKASVLSEVGGLR